MKRVLVPALAVSLLAATACTRTVVERVPTNSPAAVDVGGANPAADPVVQVVKRVRPAIVNVTTDLFQPTPFGQPGRGVGSGLLVRSDGIVVTNFHVVEGATHITVITPPPNSKRYTARVIGGDQGADLAVLKVDGQGLPTVPLGNSAQLQLGERVVALGYALALPGGPTVTSGIVSAQGRTIEAQDPNCGSACPNGRRIYNGVIQTDAAINPGNSGGSLVNLAGQVVGINTAGANQAENIGFAIPINAAKPIILQAVNHPSAPVAYLGVVTQDVGPSLAFQFNLPVNSGALVLDVVAGGPAATSGIERGDVITGFDGTAVTSSTQLRDLIHRHSPGDAVRVSLVTRDRTRKTVTVTLGVNPVPQA
jgi:serine protease Do